MTLAGRVRPDTFVDSVCLMQATERVRALPGVRAAALVMATDLNRRLLAEAGLLTSEAGRAGPTDLIIAVSAESAEAADAAVGRAEALLAGRRGEGGPLRSEAPRSIVAAARGLPGANLALVSVPGAYAAAEAHQALSAGLSVFLFSDGVALADEVQLKRRAQARGLLVMGPECGTALIDGVGLGFANRVRRGPVGLVAASGTGLQEVACLIHRLGGGVSQGIGTGGRDLCEAVGGLSTLQALAWLGRDAGTRVIGLVAKAPSGAVAQRVLDAARASGKPVVAYLAGWPGPAPAGVLRVETLEAAAQALVRALGGPAASLGGARGLRPRRRRAGRALGLYTGGTLCDEARAIFRDGLGDSAITETAGLGGFAMAAAPAIVQFVGGTAAEAIGHTRRMYEITLAESGAYRLPPLDFRGTPTGIDLRLVLQTGILPQINTGIAHRLAGIGQIGAGLVTPPLQCFEAAGLALAAALERAATAGAP
jgi:FdrA protein